MTISSEAILQRLKGLVPNGWFADRAPLRHVVFGGLADSLYWIYTQSMIVRAGTRRLGATGWLLDIDAFGFFGSYLMRRPGEDDDGWRQRYIAEINRERGTRRAVSQALVDLTGRAPTIVEPWNTGDCGAYDVGTLAWSGASVTSGPLGAYDSPYSGWDVGTWGYDLQATQSLPGSTGAGCWGSLEMPCQMFITAYRPLPNGTPHIAGFDTGAGGWDVGAFAWVGDDLNEIVATDREIYAAINRTKVAGVTAWTRIQT